jgi:hypothetical protein
VAGRVPHHRPGARAQRADGRDAGHLRRHPVRSPARHRINLLRRYRGDLRPLIREDIAYGKTVDQAIDDNLNFVRNYAQFQVPTALSAAETIGRDVLGAGAAVTRTGAFTGELENLFQSPYTTVLEEFGLPNALVKS